MRKSLVALCYGVFALEQPAQAQTPAAAPCSTPEYRQLDFWVGDWALAWDDASGGKAKGRNVITRSLGDCVIEENFDGAPGTPLIGRSLSIYDARAKTWRQTWVDNAGGVFVLTGGPRGKDFVLETAKAEGGQLRMLFTEITADSFVWLWQKTTDGGKNWTTTWRLDYRRANKDAGSGN